MENSNKDEFCTTALFSIFTNPICSHFLSCLFIYLTLVHPKRLLAPTGRLCMLSASVTPLPQSPSDTHLTSLSLCLPLAIPLPPTALYYLSGGGCRRAAGIYEKPLTIAN